jgi:hypothetical protein
VNDLIETIVSTRPEVRNRSFRVLCAGMSAADLLEACETLEQFRAASENLYERVRATLFLYTAYRFLLEDAAAFPASGPVPPQGFYALLERRFEEAIACFRDALAHTGPNGALFSALAEAYHHLSFHTLSDQVRRSVRASRGNAWMFQPGRLDTIELSIVTVLRQRDAGGLYPILRERTPVRLDLSHSGWSDIFFLGMDYPEGARVVNISVDLGVYGRDDAARPPIESYVRVIDEPLLRLTSIDLNATKDITSLDELFNFGNDYLGLLKAGVIASGLIAPGFEGTGIDLADILARIAGHGKGVELVTKVNDIPKGSRLAVSTNLLASIIGVLMRATGQTADLTGPLAENERRLAASRAILGEWLGGSGGGWQDSGGIWPGIKVIEGAAARADDPESGISKGCLLPQHRILDGHDLHPEIAERIAESLVLIHGGMAQNVGPILEMVTEKYLLRAPAEWDARNQMRGIFDGMLDALKNGDMAALARLTTQNFHGPLNTIIPWSTNCFTETLIRRCAQHCGEDFWGFLMLGGMSGGGMGLWVNPTRHQRFRDEALELMIRTKRELEDALPFAMDPVVYDFKINPHGTSADLLPACDALMPPDYYSLQVPQLVRDHQLDLAALRRLELDIFTSRCDSHALAFPMLRTLVWNLFRVKSAATPSERDTWDVESARIRSENGFDPIQHEQIRGDLRAGRIGLARNRLPLSTEIEDALDTDVVRLGEHAALRSAGEQALKEGRVAVLSLAGGLGSRWTTGAGVIKALNPFVQIAGKHRCFLELHLAKTAAAARQFGAPLPHLVSTSFLTHDPIEKHLRLSSNYGFEGPLFLSPGQSIGQRMIPMVRDLAFLWEEMPQERLDEQKQKMRENVRRAMMDWAKATGQGADYTDNMPIQRFSPPGHWYEVPNLLRNGVLADLLEKHPQVDTLLLHNIDTLGVSLDPEALGIHLAAGNMLTFEVVPRRVYDRGGGLARVDGHLRLLEGLAQPREEDELRLRYYNSMTTWIQVDPLLALFKLTRADLRGPTAHIAEAVRHVANRLPTYVTIKDVKRRWGHGQEDVYPVAQFEKLWSDMTGIHGVSCGYMVVPRLRGQQLKDPAQLDAWANDGSLQYVAQCCNYDQA